VLADVVQWARAASLTSDSTVKSERAAKTFRGAAEGQARPELG